MDDTYYVLQEWEKVPVLLTDKDIDKMYLDDTLGPLMKNIRSFPSKEEAMAAVEFGTEVLMAQNQIMAEKQNPSHEQNSEKNSNLAINNTHGKENQMEYHIVIPSQEGEPGDPVVLSQEELDKMYPNSYTSYLSREKKDLGIRQSYESKEGEWGILESYQTEEEAMAALPSVTARVENEKNNRDSVLFALPENILPGETREFKLVYDSDQEKKFAAPSDREAAHMAFKFYCSGNNGDFNSLSEIDSAGKSVRELDVKPLNITGRVNLERWSELSSLYSPDRFTQDKEKQIEILDLSAEKQNPSHEQNSEKNSRFAINNTHAKENQMAEKQKPAPKKSAEKTVPEKEAVEQAAKKQKPIPEKNAEKAVPGKETVEQATEKKKSYLQKNSEKITEGLEKGTAPFLPGKDGVTTAAAIRSADSGKVFKGMNQVLAQMYLKENGCKDDKVCTWDQAKKAGTFIKKGAKSFPLTVYEAETKESKVYHYFPVSEAGDLSKFKTPDRTGKEQLKVPAITCTDTEPSKYLGKYLAAMYLETEFKASPQVQQAFQKNMLAEIRGAENQITKPFEIGNKASKECKELLSGMYKDNYVQAKKQEREQERAKEREGPKQAKAVERS